MSEWWLLRGGGEQLSMVYVKRLYRVACIAHRLTQISHSKHSLCPFGWTGTFCTLTPEGHLADLFGRLDEAVATESALDSFGALLLAYLDPPYTPPKIHLVGNAIGEILRSVLYPTSTLAQVLRGFIGAHRLLTTSVPSYLQNGADQCTNATLHPHGPYAAHKRHHSRANTE